MLTVENLKNVFKTSAVGTLLICPDAPHFTIAYANEACLNELNTTAADLIGASAAHLAVEGNKLASYRGILLSSLSYTLIFKKAINTQCYPLLDEDGQVAYLVFSLIMDAVAPLIEKPSINQMEEAQASVIFNQQSATILESITDAFFALDKDWLVTYWNKEAENVMQMSRHEIIGKNIWEIFPDATSLPFYKEYQIAMLENVPRQFEVYYPLYHMWLDVCAYPSKEGISVFFRDIGQRVESDKQLELAKQNYETLFNLSPLPMCVYDINTLRYLDVNQAAIDHYGYNYEEFMNMTLEDIRPNTALQNFNDMIRNEVNSGNIHTRLVTHQKKNGELITVETRGNTIDFGNHKARLVALIDVTKTIAAEESVKRSEQYFKALIQSGSELIAIIDAEGRYSYFNSNTNAILGVDPEFFLGKSPFNFIHLDDIPTVKLQMETIDTKKRIKISPFRFYTSKGHYRWLESVITDMRDDPAVGGLVTNSRDVTHRIEYEIKLKESIERFNLVSKATSDAIFDWEAQNNVLFWGEGFRENFGYEPGASLQFSDWQAKIHPDDMENIVSGFHQCVQSKETKYETKYRFRCSDGSYKAVLQKCTLIYNKAGTLLRMLGSIQDITEIVNHIKAIEAQNAILNEISWTQSHVVRAPIARLIGLLSLVNIEDLGPVNQEVFTHLHLSAAELDLVTTEIIKKTEAVYKSIT
ncbi:PAS domain-containing protein [Pedobacter sp.]|uniref:PAS domain-containing protein n=1 Tax=Pedobacter sp. TaxID=1411316 RepID=UPI003D7F5D99